jgi:hypothetical protein
VQLRHRLGQILIQHSLVVARQEHFLAAAWQQRFQWLQDFFFESVEV